MSAASLLRRITRLAALASLSALCSAALAAPQAGGGPVQKVEVFANSSMLVQNVGQATVYRVDGLRMLELELSQGLPADQAQAARVAQARMRGLGSALRERTQNAMRGLALARHYGVDRMPAVVVNGQAIIYGVTDVAEALRHYEQAAARGHAPMRPRAAQ